MIYFSLLPESARWMISKGQYGQAEKLLRKIAKTNKRRFDEEAFQRMKADQEKVCHSCPTKNDHVIFHQFYLNVFPEI